jgi:hypothetical protein
MRYVWHKEKRRRLFGRAYEGLGTEKIVTLVKNSYKKRIPTIIVKKRSKKENLGTITTSSGPYGLLVPNTPIEFFHPKTFVKYFHKSGTSGLRPYYLPI